MLVCCKESAIYVHYSHSRMWSFIHLKNVLGASVVGSSGVRSLGAPEKPESLFLPVSR